MEKPKRHTKGFGKGGFKTERLKVRRVSQRKELAVVTLGMVATITDVGGLLTASPPSGVASEAAATGSETTTVIQLDPPPSDGKALGSADVEGNTSAVAELAQGGGETPERGGGASQPEQTPVWEQPVQTPSWSTSSPQQAPAPAMSRGS
jgi:hypothetical protein